jgi:hypothetical protein
MLTSAVPPLVEPFFKENEDPVFGARVVDAYHTSAAADGSRIRCLGNRAYIARAHLDSPVLCGRSLLTEHRPLQSRH